MRRTPLEVVTSPLILCDSFIFYFSSLRVLTIQLFTLLTPDRRVLLTGEIQEFITSYSADLMHRLADLQLPVAEMLSGIVSLPAAEMDNIFLFYPYFLRFACR